MALAQGKSPVSSYYNPPPTPTSKKSSVTSGSSTSTSKTSISSASSRSSSNSFATNSQFIQHSFPQQPSFSSFPVSQPQFHEQHLQEHEQPKHRYPQQPISQQSPFSANRIISPQHQIPHQPIQLPQQQGYLSPAPQNSMVMDYNTYNYQQYYQPSFSTVVTSTTHPNWPLKFQELIKHYQDQSSRFTPSFPYLQYLWRDYALGLSAKHPFLGTAICTFASLHLDFNTQPFSPSSLSLELYEQTVAQCSAMNVDETNFEALYFATSLIWLCSYRLIKMVPFYRRVQDLSSPTDIMSLYKGPQSILVSFKAHLPTSPLNKLMIGAGSGSEFDNNPLLLAPVNILDDLLILACLTANLESPSQQPVTIAQHLETIRSGQHSPPPPIDEIYSTSSGSGSTGSSSYYQYYVAYYQAINSLKYCVRQAITLSDLSKLHEWPQAVNAEYLALLRTYEQNPFALVILNYFLVMLLFMSHPSMFWLHERLLYEIRSLSQQLSEQSWGSVLEWPNMVLQTVEIQQQMKDEPLGVLMFKQMVQYRL